VRCGPRAPRTVRCRIRGTPNAGGVRNDAALQTRPRLAADNPRTHACAGPAGVRTCAGANVSVMQAAAQGVGVQARMVIGMVRRCPQV
jgi:hypothetical protein